MARRGGWGCAAGVLLAAVVLAVVLVGVLILDWVGSDPESPPAGPPYGSASVACEVQDPRILESSGLAVVADTWYTVNDSAQQLEIYVLDTDCTVREVLTYPQIDPVDVEDLAVSADGDLWVADTGDNYARRPEVALYRIPDRGAGTPTTLRLAYDDGAHDVETLLLSPEDVPYLVTKTSSGNSRVYAPAGELDPDGLTMMTQVAAFQFVLTGTAGGPASFVGQLMATGGSVAPDGDRFVVRTYTDAYVWDLDGTDVLGALREETPRRVALPATPQGEAISLTADAGEMYSTTEGSPFPVHVQRRTDQ